MLVERYLRKPNWDDDIIPWDKTNLLRLRRSRTFKVMQVM